MHMLSSQPLLSIGFMTLKQRTVLYERKLGAVHRVHRGAQWYNEAQQKICSFAVQALRQ